MKRQPFRLFFLFLALAVALTACASAAPVATPTSEPGTKPRADLARTDSQGMVEFVVTPLNLSASSATLDFDVSMNTHSVDLAWDLAAQSTLATDTGLAVNGLSWPMGNGHHYEGTVSFPTKSIDGQVLLDGAKTLTLTIRDTDVTERVFVWELSQ